MSMQNAFLGSLVGDAISMPVHWYYNRDSLDCDYGDFDDYLPPRNPHPDSILWRSSYHPIGPKADILPDQAKHWGKRGCITISTFGQVKILSTLNFRSSSIVGSFCVGSMTWMPGYAATPKSCSPLVGTVIPMPRNTTQFLHPVCPWQSTNFLCIT